MMGRSPGDPRTLIGFPPDPLSFLATGAKHVPPRTPVAPPVRHPVPHLAVGTTRAESVVADAAGAHSNLAYPGRGVRHLGGRLRLEPFVNLRMRVDDQLRARGVQRVPRRLYRHVVLRR